MTQADFGDRLYQLRQALGLSQYAAAAMIGIKSGHYSSLEKGEINPNLDTLNKIACGFGISLVALLAEEKPIITKHDETSNKIMAYVLAIPIEKRKYALKMMKALYDIQEANS